MTRKDGHEGWPGGIMNQFSWLTMTRSGVQVGAVQVVSSTGGWSACAMLLLMATGCGAMWGQSASGSQLPAAQESSPAIARAADGNGYTLHVTAREVVVEVVARDRNNRPVNDLDQNEFEIFESTHKSKDAEKLISGFKRIDPASDLGRPDGISRSVVLPLGGRCEVRSTIHYELAFHPARWTSGYHTILVTTTRQHVKLSYRVQFYVGLSEAETPPARRDAKAIDSALLAAACYHPDVPASLSLSAIKMDSQSASKLQYSVEVLPSSLDLAGIEGDSHHVQLEYGVCTFSRSGHVLGYWHFSEDRVLSSDGLSQVFSDGWKETVDVSRHGNPALARFVVLEPKTGNLGTVDLSTDPRILADVADVPAESAETAETAETAEPNDSELKGQTHVLVASDDAGVQTSRRGRTLGSPVPRQNALCGDVYELPTATTLLPGDFRKLNAVGAVYADSLNVSEQILSLGLPGATTRSEWFGIDYYGEFWISRAGKYEFVLNADDGADLYIDDHMVINDDGIHPPRTAHGSITLNAGTHTIHMPYFQGPTYVNLILQVRPPDESLKVFNVRDFSQPFPNKPNKQHSADNTPAEKTGSRD
jgi:hypothetical protein